MLVLERFTVYLIMQLENGLNNGEYGEIGKHA